MNLGHEIPKRTTWAVANQDPKSGDSLLHILVEPIRDLTRARECVVFFERWVGETQLMG